MTASPAPSSRPRSSRATGSCWSSRARSATGSSRPSAGPGPRPRSEDDGSDPAEVAQRGVVLGRQRNGPGETTSDLSKGEEAFAGLLHLLGQIVPAADANAEADQRVETVGGGRDFGRV